VQTKVSGLCAPGLEAWSLEPINAHPLMGICYSVGLTTKVSGLCSPGLEAWSLEPINAHPLMGIWYWQPKFQDFAHQAWKPGAWNLSTHTHWWVFGTDNQSFRTLLTRPGSLEPGTYQRTPSDTFAELCIKLGSGWVGADAGDEARFSRRVLLNLVGLEFLVCWDPTKYVKSLNMLGVRPDRTREGRVPQTDAPKKSWRPCLIYWLLVFCLNARGSVFLDRGLFEVCWSQLSQWKTQAILTQKSR
jgi:hypothetical protein